MPTSLTHRYGYSKKFQTIVETEHKIELITFFIAKRTSQSMDSLIGLQSAVTLCLVNVQHVHGEERSNDGEVNRIMKMKDVLIKVRY